MNSTDPSSNFAFLHEPLLSSPATSRLEEEIAPEIHGAETKAMPVVAEKGHVSARPKPWPEVPGYSLLSELGRGGMGVVYLARQEKLHRLVALKMILGGGHADADSLARFRMEAEVISQLRHPNIVQIFEMGESDGHAYFSMEFLPDGSLFKRQQEQPLVPREAAALIRTLALAMHAVHDKGILHRDLKPANILLQSADGRLAIEDGSGPISAYSAVINWQSTIPKITDFGLAKRVAAEGMTQSGVILGTPEYMAPEQARGDADQLGPAVDIYALGAMLYEFLAGRPPFKGYTPMETVLQAITEEVLPPSRLQPKTPRDLETICLKCLQKDPAKRYATARDLADDLQRFLDGAPILARPAGPIERAVKWARRKPAWAALFITHGVAIILLCVGVAILRQAHVQEVEQRQLAEQNEARALQAQHLAEANFREAKNAVDQSFRLVTEQPPFNQEHMREARKVLLEQALPFYRRFLEQRGNDPTLRQEMAQTHRRIGIILRAIGSKEEALEHLLQSCTLLQQLAQAQPEELSLHAELAAAWHDLGGLLNELSRFAEAEPAFRKAIQGFDRLRAQRPKEKRYQESWADAWHSLAKLQMAQGQFDSALKSWDTAYGVWQKLAARHKGEERYQARVAACWITRAQLFTANGAHLRAEVTYAEALKRYTELLAHHPDSTDYRAALAATHVNLGINLAQRRNFSTRGEIANPQAAQEKYRRQAEDHYRQALTHYQHLNIAHPSVTEYLASHAATLINLGSVQQARGRLTEAMTSFHEAEAKWDKLIGQHPNVLRFQTAKGATQYNRGVVAVAAGHESLAQEQFAIASKTLQAVLAKQPQEAEARRFLAEIHVQQARRATQQGQHDVAAREWAGAVNLGDGGEKQRDYGVEHALALVRAGDPAAEQTLAQWPQRKDWKGRHYFNFARGYALLAARTTDPVQQNRLAELALQLLHQARDANLFRTTPSYRHNLSMHPDFAPLREQPAFQKFLQELEAPGSR